MSASSKAVLRVVRVERASCLVLGNDGPFTVSSALPVTVGDWVTLGAADQVVEVAPRSSEIRRAAPSGRSEEQVLAANVDVVGICTPLEWGARAGRLERFLALAWSSGATPVILATKSDLCPSAEVDEALRQLALAAPGVDVIAVSISDPTSLDPVRALVSTDRTLALLGASGVGKSSLVNALVGAAHTAVQEIREDGKGRHTTTWRELVALPGGGYLIDTPGLRGVGMIDYETGVAAAFADIESLAQECRFSDCRHVSEPDCGVLAAVEDGSLDVARLERHRKLQREVAFQLRRVDARAKAEYSRRWKAIAKANRDRTRW